MMYNYTSEITISADQKYMCISTELEHTRTNYAMLF